MRLVAHVTKFGAGGAPKGDFVPEFEDLAFDTYIVDVHAVHAVFVDQGVLEVRVPPNRSVAPTNAPLVPARKSEHKQCIQVWSGVRECAT